MELNSTFIGAAAFLLTAGIAVVGAVKWINTLAEAIRKECLQATSTARTELVLILEKATESEAKQRHALANQTTGVTIELRRDVEEIKKDTVRRVEMTQMEQRLVGRVDSLERKMDHQGEKLSELTSVSRANNDMLSRLVTQLDKKA
jgi:hypothetical protein